MGVLWAGVPALTASNGVRSDDQEAKFNSPVFWSVLRVDTFVVDVVEHQAVSAAQLLGSGRELTDDVFSAGSWVRERWVSKRDAIGTNCLSLRTLETINVWLGSIPLALPGKGGCLFLPDTGALGFVKYQRRGAVVQVRIAVDTVVVSRYVSK